MPLGWVLMEQTHFNWFRFLNSCFVKSLTCLDTKIQIVYMVNEHHFVNICSLFYVILFHFNWNTSVTRAYGWDFTIAVELQNYKQWKS